MRLPALLRLVRPTRIDRYILSEMVPYFLVGFAFFNLVFIVNKLLEMMDMLIVKRADAAAVLTLFVSMLPFIFAVTIPISVLVAVLMAFGRLSSDSEIVALLSAGTGYLQMLRAPFAVGLAVSLFMVWFNDRVLPAGNYLFKRTYREIALSKPISQLQEHRFVTIDDRVFGVGRIDPKTGVIYDIVIYERDRTTGQSTVTVARRGLWLENQRVRDRQGRTFQIMRLQLEEGSVQGFEGTDGSEFHSRAFDRMVVSIRVRLTEEIDVERSARELSIAELGRQIRQAAADGLADAVNDLRVEYHKKFAIPFASLAFVLLGTALALIPKKTGVGYGLGMSLAVIFVYYLLLTVGESFGKSGRMPPALGVWYTNLILAGTGAAILGRLSR